MICTSCKQDKDETAFARNRSRACGRQHQCKQCFTARYAKKDPVVSRAQHLRHFYKLAWSDYEDMYQNQNGCCAICKTPIQLLSKDKLITAHVDHEHESTDVRGLLCHFCNSGLGYFRDRIELLETAIMYLKAHKK